MEADCSTRRSTRKEQQQLERAAKTPLILDPTFQTLWQKHGLEPPLSRTMTEQETPEDRCSTFRMMIGAAEASQDFANELTEAVWGHVAEKENIWEDVGGEAYLKAEERYDEREGPRRAQYQGANNRKRNARESLKQVWGEDWEEKFDPVEKRLQKTGGALAARNGGNGEGRMAKPGRVDGPEYSFLGPHAWSQKPCRHFCYSSLGHRERVVDKGRSNKQEGEDRSGSGRADGRVA